MRYMLCGYACLNGSKPATGGVHYATAHILTVAPIPLLKWFPTLLIYVNPADQLVLTICRTTNVVRAGRAEY